MKKCILNVVFMVMLCQLSGQSSFTLNIKAWLEGPYNGNIMNTGLNSAGVIPLTQPYNQPPWNYDGLEAVASVPQDVVDWILVDLRETAGNASTAYEESRIARKAGFIRADGTVVSTDGISQMQFGIDVVNKLFLALFHRNHLAVISAHELVLDEGCYSYDFTTGAEQALGGILAQEEMVPGSWGLVAGDGDANGQVNNIDKNQVWYPQSGTIGYLQGDFNLNANVDNIDKISFWADNVGKSTQLPGSWFCGKPMAMIHDLPEVTPYSKTIIYGTTETTLSGTNHCWITQNLGADHQAINAFDTLETSAGWYWQFNRIQGYGHNGITVTPGWTVTYIDENSNWQPENDPCSLLLGTGWRLPSYTEWYNTDVNGNWNNYFQPFASILKLHTAGLLLYNDGSIILRGIAGDYWSSAQFNNLYAYGLGFGSVHCGVGFSAKAYGFTIRCLKE